jgi:hypothetical protein
VEGVAVSTGEHLSTMPKVESEKCFAGIGSPTSENDSSGVQIRASVGLMLFEEGSTESSALEAMRTGAPGNVSLVNSRPCRSCEYPSRPSENCDAPLEGLANESTLRTVVVCGNTSNVSVVHFAMSPVRRIKGELVSTGLSLGSFTEVVQVAPHMKKVA